LGHWIEQEALSLVLNVGKKGREYSYFPIGRKSFITSTNKKSKIRIRERNQITIKQVLKAGKFYNKVP